MDKIPTFDSISELIDLHGEPSNCEVQNCEDCKTINFARNFYAGGEGNRKSFYIPPPKYKYYVIDENGKEKTFTRMSDVVRYIKTSEKYINPIINTGESYKGYVVVAEKLGMSN